MHWIRPAILLLFAVLAPPAAAATLEEQAASAAVLEEEAVNTTDSVSQLSPQVAVDPGDPTRQIVAATEYLGSGPVTAAWRRSGTSWTRLPGSNLDPGPGLTSRGGPDLTWGVGNELWLAHLGEDTGAGTCDDASGVFLSHSTDGGTSFSTPSEPYAPNQPATALPHTWDDVRVVMDRDGGGNVVEPLVVGSITTWAAASNCTAQTGHAIAIAGPGENAQSSIYSFSGGLWPSAVTLPGHILVVAYFSETSNRVAVRRLTPLAPGAWNELGTTSFPTNPATSAGGVAVTSAPDLAVGPDGRLHLVYTVQDGDDTDVVYRYSDDGGVTWSAPVSVADPAGEEANQFLPAVTVGPTTGTTISGGRAEIAYLDDRDAGPRYRPFLTAFAQFAGDPAPTRGGNRPLDGTTHAVPAQGVGNRLAVAATLAPSGDTSAPSGVALAWWPNSAIAGPSDPAKLYRSRVNHGAEAPVVSSATIGTSKNVPVSVPDLLSATDGDGDPVRVSVIAAPAHGSLQGTTLTPSTGYAGADVLTLLADDGQPRGSIQRQIAIGNAPPVLPDVKSPLYVAQGGSATLQLAATDADPGDQLRYELVQPLPSQIANAVSITESGLLTVRPSKTARSSSILDVRVRVTDTTPLVGGSREALVPVKINAVYGALDVSVEVTGAGTSKVARFVPQIDDEDQERGLRSAIYSWDFGDGSVPSSLVSPRHTYTKPGTYTWTLRLTMPRSEGSVGPVVRQGTLDVNPSGITVVRTKQTLKKKQKQLKLNLNSRLTGSVRITLRAGSVTTKAVIVELTANRARSLTLSTKSLGKARNATLTIRFTSVLAGPLPTAIHKSVRLR